MNAQRWQRSSVWIRWLGLGLICIGVAMVSYLFGRELIATRISQAQQREEAAPSPGPSRAPPTRTSSPRISILPTKAAAEPPEEPAEATDVEEVAPEPESATYAVQVAAFSTPERAQEFAKRLSEKGHSALVEKSGTETQPAYAVIASEHKDRKEAEEALSALKEDFPDAFLKRLTTSGG